MRDAGASRSDWSRAAELLVYVEQRVDRSIPNGMCCELQAGLNRRPYNRQEAFLWNEQQSAILRVRDRINLADAPGIAHIGAAGQHSPIKKSLDADDFEHRVGLAQWVGSDLANVCLDVLD